MSDADRFRDVERMWTAALAIDEEGRAAFLEQACAGDDWLRHEVASLLSHDESSAQFLEQPAVYEVAAMDASDRESLVGHEIDGYRITAVLGVGGMGDVYRAVDVTLGREVALKVLSRALMTHTADTQRFEAEARAASALNHPNIVTIYGVGRIGDIAYIAMELVRGRTLRALAEPSAVARTIDYAVQLADALSAAHAAGIIHRDLKPENVMVTDEGLVKVLDFGIAKRIAETDLWSGVIAAEPARYLTEAGTIVGTAEYMSPEQAMGRELDHRSDQFSFGAILYELLTVRRAFERATREETIAAVVNDQPAALGPAASSAIAALQRVVERCLSKDPLARYASTRELAAELRAIRDTSTSVPALTRRRAIALGVAAAVTGIAGAASWRLWTSGPSVSKLAVLPFANPAGDDNIAYLCDGIAESLIRRLSSVTSLKLTALSAVTHLKTTEPAAVGRDLAVDAVLTGAITRRAQRLMVTTELVDVNSRARIWGDTFDRQQADVLAVQDEITGAIIRALNVRPDEGAERRLARVLTTDPAAYELYLQGVHHFRLQQEDDYLIARRLLTQAVEQDGEFALAYVTLASTYSVTAIDGYEAPRSAWPNQIAHIARAIQLDPDLPDAHAEATASAFYYQWDWSAAEREWQAALKSRRGEIQPELLFARALQQWALGRSAEALEFARAARLADPLSAALRLREADLLARTRQFDAAAAMYQKTIDDAPDDPRAFFGLAEVRRLQARFDEAISLRRQVHEPGFDAAFDRLVSTAQGAEGYLAIEAASARLELETLRVRSAVGSYVSPLEYARIHARLGEREQTFSLFGSAFDDRAAGLVFLNVDPAWDRVRDDPRFLKAVHTVGLPA